MKTISLEQFQKQYPGVSPALVPSSRQPNYFQRVGAQVKQAGQDIGRAVQTSGEQFGLEDTSLAGTAVKTGTLLRSVARTGGAVSRAAFAPLTEAPGVKQGLEAVGTGIAQIPGVPGLTEKIQGLAQKYPETAQDVQDILDITGLVGATKAVPAVAKGVQKAVTPVAKGVAQTVSAGTAPVGRVISPVVESATRIPKRIAVNVAERQAQRQTIQQLPSKGAQNAARAGVDIADVQAVSSVPVAQKAPLRKLWQSIKNYAENKTTKNPIEVIGRTFSQGIEKLQTLRASIGSKLGAVAQKELGTVTTREIFRPVFDALRKVPGMQGLLVDGRGNLIFTNTTLAATELASERAAIQTLFGDAIKSGSGVSKHQLRQGIFEILGGKKKANLLLTDTTDKAYQAIREGISSVLESKSPSYKTLSAAYRKTMEPLTEIKQVFKSVTGADEDIINMQAGILARRLTATGSQQIRSILRKMDNALALAKTKGKVLTNLESLQDFYNILDRYYDIAPKTGFQGQTRAGVEKATSFGGAIAEQVRNVAGETPAVRRAALEELLDEVLR